MFDRQITVNESNTSSPDKSSKRTANVHTFTIDEYIYIYVILLINTVVHFKNLFDAVLGVTSIHTPIVVNVKNLLRRFFFEYISDTYLNTRTKYIF